MDFDDQIGVLTLLLAGSFVTAVGCAFVIAAWWRMPEALALWWWAGSLAVRSIYGILTAAGFAGSRPWLVIAGAAVMPFGSTALWNGIRTFEKRSTPWWMFVLMPAVWLVGVQLPFPGGAPTAALASAMAISAALGLAVCFELWRGRAEKLTARWPLIVVTAFNTVILIVGVIDAALGNLQTTAVPPLMSWFSFSQLAFVTILLGCTALVIMMCRERADAIALAVARLDALTGIANRGSWFVRAERILRRASEEAASVSLIVFDLDNFKTINDTYGHVAGDRVLRAFAATATALLRPSDLIGRIGGEEFCVVLSGTALEAAYVIAERIRHAFEVAPLVFGEATISATVSAGVATNDKTATVEILLESADRALYRAKAKGRNRVERAGERPLAVQKSANLAGMTQQRRRP